jgi:hypothetical protein
MSLLGFKSFPNLHTPHASPLCAAMPTTSSPARSSIWVSLFVSFRKHWRKRACLFNSDVFAGRRSLLSDAAVAACGLLDAANVTAVELTPVTYSSSSHAALIRTHINTSRFFRPRRTISKRFTPMTTSSRSRPRTLSSPHAMAPSTFQSSRNLDCERRV